MQRYYKVRKKDRNGGSQLTPPSPTTTSSTTFSNKAIPIVVVALILLNGAYLQWQYTRDAHAATRVYWEEEVAVVKTSSSHDTPSASNKYRNAKHDDETSSASSSALSFVHIPKTAGSAIEKIGKRAQQKWGYFESCFGKSFSECINQSTCRADGNNVANNNSSLPCAPGCAEWHDPELLSAKYKKIDAAATTTTFCVIRHPVERMLSSFKYNQGKGRRVCSIKNLNLWAKNTIWTLENKNPNHLVCHFRHQSDFPCQRKLLFDDLERQFDALMRDHSFDLTFRVKTNNLTTAKTTTVKKSRDCPRLTVRDFDVATEKLITRYYAKDMAVYYRLLSAFQNTTASSH